jgi:hypothetical protein
MKKYIHTIFAITTFLILSCNSQPKKLDIDLKEIVKNNPGINEGSGTFNINALDGWSKTDTSVSGVRFVILKSAVESSKDKFAENVNVVTEKLNGMNLEEYFNANLKSLQNGMPGFQNKSNQDLTINGLNSKQLNYSGNVSGYPIDVQVYFFVKNNVGYVITCSAEEGKMDKWASRFKEIVNSFTIN